jgi:hypothetical protein
VPGKELLIDAPQVETMRIEKRTLGWLPKPSRYQEAVASRAKFRESNNTFMATSGSLLGTVSNINLNQVTEAANITARVAKARILSKLG